MKKASVPTSRSGHEPIGIIQDGKALAGRIRSGRRRMDDVAAERGAGPFVALGAHVGMPRIGFMGEL